MNKICAKYTKLSILGLGGKEFIVFCPHSHDKDNYCG